MVSQAEAGDRSSTDYYGGMVIFQGLFYDAFQGDVKQDRKRVIAVTDTNVCFKWFSYAVV